MESDTYVNPIDQVFNEFNEEEDREDGFKSKRLKLDNGRRDVYSEIKLKKRQDQDMGYGD